MDMKSNRKYVFPLVAALSFLFFFNGYSNSGPARSKFQKLPWGEEDLTTVQKDTYVNRLDKVMKDSRLKKWERYWKGCRSDFSLASMDDIGEMSIDYEPLGQLTDKDMDGPSRMFYQNSPDGKRILNPFWGRLKFKPLEKGYEAEIEWSCGAALYEPKANKASLILRCGGEEGLDDGFWLDANRLVVVGYEQVTRQMSADCESVKACIAPTVWLMDLKAGSINQYRGPAISQNKCESFGYIRERLPKFFGKDGAMQVINQPEK